MRSRILFLAAGFPAYFIGATVNAYLRGPEELRRLRRGGGRTPAAVEHPRAAALHPFKAIEHLVAPVRTD